MSSPFSIRTLEPLHAAPTDGVGGSRPLRTALHLLLLALIALPWVAKIYAAVAFSVRDCVDLLFDDTYYNLGTAWHLAYGEGSKFAQPLVTNGYQPLWLLMLCAAGWILRLSRHGLMVFTLAAMASRQLSALAWSLFSIERRMQRLGYGLSVGYLTWGVVFSMGLETALLPPLVAPLCVVVDNVEHNRVGHGWALALLSTLFLMRLDTLALLAAYLILRTWVRGVVDGRALRLAGVMAAVVGLYMLINELLFHTPLPVSGIAKSIGGRTFENVGALPPCSSGLEWAASFLAIGWLLKPAGVEAPANRRSSAEQGAAGVSPQRVPAKAGHGRSSTVPRHPLPALRCCLSSSFAVLNPSLAF